MPLQLLLPTPVQLTVTSQPVNDRVYTEPVLAAFPSGRPYLNWYLARGHTVQKLNYWLLVRFSVA